MTVSVPSRVELLVPVLVILLPLLRVAQHRVRVANGFKGLRSPWRVVLIRVKLQREFPVRLFQVLVRSFSVDSQNFVVIFALLYPPDGIRLVPRVAPRRLPGRLPAAARPPLGARRRPGAGVGVGPGARCLLLLVELLQEGWNGSGARIKEIRGKTKEFGGK